ADEGMKELKDCVDTLIAIPNQRLLSVAGRNSSMLESFKKADDVLLQAVRGISDLVTVHGLINLDFADVRAIMSEMRMAMMGAAGGRITVLAPGLGERPEAGEKPRSATRDGRPAAAGEGRPVKRLGLLAEDELDVPTWQRRRQEPPVAAARGAQRPAPKGADEEPAEDYKVPTFLRRGAD